MNNHFKSLLMLLLVSLTLAQNRAPDKLTVYFFGSSTCGECNEIKQFVLQPLEKKYAGTLSIRYHDTDDKAGFALLMKLEEAFNITDPSPQELFLPDTFLAGYETIMESAQGLIEHYLARPEKWKHGEVAADTASLNENLNKRIRRFTFLGVLAGGMVDGINPCAIATMIFLISFLATQKRKRSEVLIIGLFFTATVFVTYLLLGLGAFKALTGLQQYIWLSEAIRWTAVAAAGIVAIISFYDAFSYMKSKETRDIKIQLPKAVKLQIHKVISGNLKGSQLIIGAIVTGFLVTLLEAVCTGQVYIPTIILMAKSTGFKLKGWLYLIFYNFLFVLPLLIVMVLAYFGLKWNELAKSTQKHLTLIKILVGLVLAGLAVFLAVAG